MAARGLVVGLLLVVISTMSVSATTLLPYAPFPAYSKMYNCAGTTRYIYAATTATYGRELFVTDSSAVSATGSTLLKDIFFGETSSNPDSFVALPNGKILFLATNLDEGRELWVTDCTAANTRLLVAGAAGPDDGQISGLRLASTGSDVAFSFQPPSSGWKIGFTDGITADINGPAIPAAMANANPFSAPRTHGACMDKWFVGFGSVSGGDFDELWELTKTNFSQVYDFSVSSTINGVGYFTCHRNERIIFTAYNSSASWNNYVWDGTTMQGFGDFSNQVINIEGYTFNNEVYFFDNIAGGRIRRFEGAAIGAALVPGRPLALRKNGAAIIGNNMYFYYAEYNSTYHPSRMFTKVIKFDGTNWTPLTLPAGYDYIGDDSAASWPILAAPLSGASTNHIAYFALNFRPPTDLTSINPTWMAIKNDNSVVAVAAIADGTCLSDSNTLSNSLGSGVYHTGMDFSDGFVAVGWSLTAGVHLQKLAGAATPVTFFDISPGVDYLLQDGFAGSNMRVANSRAFFPLFATNTGIEMYSTNGTGFNLVYDSEPGCASEFRAGHDPALQVIRYGGVDQLIFQNYYGDMWITDGVTTTFLYPRYQFDFFLFCPKMFVFATPDNYYWNLGDLGTSTNYTFDAVGDIYCSPSTTKALVLNFITWDGIWLTLVNETEEIELNFYSPPPDFEASPEYAWDDDIPAPVQLCDGAFVALYYHPDDDGRVETFYITATSNTSLGLFAGALTTFTFNDHSLVLVDDSEPTVLRLFDCSVNATSYRIFDLADIGAYSLPYGLAGAVSVHGKLFFRVKDESSGYEAVMETDFTAAGTQAKWDTANIPGTLDSPLTVVQAEWIVTRVNLGSDYPSFVATPATGLGFTQVAPVEAFPKPGAPLFWWPLDQRNRLVFPANDPPRIVAFEMGSDCLINPPCFGPMGGPVDGPAGPVAAPLAPGVVEVPTIPQTGFASAISAPAAVTLLIALLLVVVGF